MRIATHACPSTAMTMTDSNERNDRDEESTYSGKFRSRFASTVSSLTARRRATAVTD